MRILQNFEYEDIEGEEIIIKKDTISEVCVSQSEIFSSYGIAEELTKGQIDYRDITPATDIEIKSDIEIINPLD